MICRGEGGAKPANRQARRPAPKVRKKAASARDGLFSLLK